MWKLRTPKTNNVPCLYYIIWLVHKLGAQKSLTDVHVCVPLSFFFILLFILTALEHHGVWWPLNSAASNNSVRVKVELKESHFKLTFHCWQPSFDHSTTTLNNFVSLNYFVNFQAFCKYLPFSLQRQIPVYSPFVICCPRSVDVTFPSSLSFLLLYLFYFSTFSSSYHPLH